MVEYNSDKWWTTDISQQKLMTAYLSWRKKKSIKHFSILVRDGFSGGLLVWRTGRVIKNIVSGKYERLYEKYWKEYDI